VEAVLLQMCFLLLVTFQAFQACQGQAVGMVAQFEQEESKVLDGSNGTTPASGPLGGRGNVTAQPARLVGTVPQGVWASFPEVGLATFSAYRLEPDLFAWVVHVAKDSEPLYHSAKGWTANEKLGVQLYAAEQ